MNEPQHVDVDPSSAVGLLPLPAAVVARDDLSLLAANKVLGALLDVQPQTLVGRSIAELLPPGRAQLVLDAARQVTDTAQSLEVTLALGGRDLQGLLTLAPGPTAESLLLVYADNTELHEEVSNLRAVVSAVSAASRNLGHEMQAELTVVAGYSRMLATAGERISTLERTRLHERVAEAAQRAATLSRETSVEHVTRSSATASLTDVMSWVEHATALRLEDTDATLVWDVDGQVQVEAGVLRQVLVRLVEDALTRRDVTRPHHVHVAMRPAADGLEVVVTDSAEDGRDELDHMALADMSVEPTTLQAERAMVTHVGGLLSSVPTARGTRHVLWLPGRD